MATYNNNCEGTTAGTTVATGQTGSGDAFTLVDSATGTGTIVYSTAQAAHGGQSIALTGISGASRHAGWNGDTVSSAAVRVYIYLNALPAATCDFLSIRRVGASGTGKLQVSATGALILANAAGAAVKTFATVLDLNKWYRVEIQTTKGTTTSDGYLAAQYYLGDSTLAIDRFSTSATNTGTTDYIGPRIGKITTTTATWDGYFDDYSWNGGTTTPIGAAGQSSYMAAT